MIHLAKGQKERLAKDNASKPCLTFDPPSPTLFFYQIILTFSPADSVSVADGGGGVGGGWGGGASCPPLAFHHANEEAESIVENGVR